MVIDFHTHIFPESIAEATIDKLGRLAHIQPACSGTVHCLLDTMKHAGIDLSVVVPVVTRPSQFEHVNSFAALVNRTYKGKLHSFGGIHPDCEEYQAKLDTIKAMGLKGVKIHPDCQGVMIDDDRYLRIIEYADHIGLIVLTHAGIDIGEPDPVHCPPEKMRKVLEQLRPKRMVLGHYGGFRMWEQVYEELAGQSVYLDTAFTIGQIDEELFLSIYEKHDKDKLLYASDSPWSDPIEDLKILARMKIREEDRAGILGENGRRLLHLAAQ
ncbi:MAG: amidohydrolase family protein [Lachnospiraceae bacterium]|nr:amidohydrolase family protein [Lachnospiraceae bacterium]